MVGSCLTDLCLSKAATLLLLSILDSESADKVRKQRQSIVNLIDSLCSQSDELKSYTVGDFLSKTTLLLPPSASQLQSRRGSQSRISTEKVELTLFYDSIESPHRERWSFFLYEALCSLPLSVKSHPGHVLASVDPRTEMKDVIVDRISYFPGDKVLEAVIDGTFVSIKPNNISSLAFASILEDCDATIGNQSLLKRSILLIKAWCRFEAPIVCGKESESAAAGSAFKKSMQILSNDNVVEVMVMWLFSSNILSNSDDASSLVNDPLKVLLLFLNVFSRFEWNKWAVSAAGLVPLPSLSPLNSHSEEDDIGTETDSPCQSQSNPHSSVAVDAYPSPVTSDSPLSAIVNKYRDRLRLELHVNCILKKKIRSPRVHNGDTDEEDNSCDSTPKESRELVPKGERDQEEEDIEETTTAPTLPMIGSVVAGKDTSHSHVEGEIVVLDPTKQWTNLCVGSSKEQQRAGPLRVEDREAQQESFRNIFLFGSKSIQQTVESACKLDGSDSDISDAERVMKLVTESFPGLCKSVQVREASILVSEEVSGAIIASLLRTDVPELKATLNLAEATLSPKMSPSAVEDLVFRTISEKGPQSVQDIEATLKTLPAAVGWFEEADESPRLRTLLRQGSAKLLLDEDDLVRVVTAAVKAGRVKEECADNETASEGSSAMISASPTLPDTHEAQDNLGLSDITISKSFSSFESDQGSDSFINLTEGQLDPSMRLFSQYNTPLLSRESSGMSLPRDSSISSLLGIQGARTPSSGTTSAGGGDEDKTVYHQHQKTLQRRSQNMSGQAIISSTRPPPVSVPRSVDYPLDHTSPGSIQSLSKGQSPITVPSPPLKPPTPPFIQPFVVKEMQVWVPGKFGSSSTSAVTATSKTPPLPVPGAGAKNFMAGYPIAGYPAMGATHQVVTPPTAGRYSPVQGAPVRPANNYGYPPPEDEFDVNWVDPDDGTPRIRASRMALAGHQQMQGQLVRGQRPNGTEHGTQYARMSRSPMSDQGSPSSTSPPTGSAGGYPNSKRQLPVNAASSAFIAQTNRLNYSGSNGNSNIGGLMRTSSPLLQSQGQGQVQQRDRSPMLRESSPPGMGMGIGAPEINDFDNWSLSNQQHSSQLLRLQQQQQQYPQSLLPSDGSFTAPGAGVGTVPGTGLRGLEQEQMRILQQQRMGLLAAENRSMFTTSQREKSEAQLPSFLRDL